MKYVKFKDLELSLFQLGTVQLGMDYGLGDHTAKPKKEYAFSLLDRATADGVNTLDTANNYGDSERVIGEWLKTVDADKKPTVITKIGPFDHSSPEILREDILTQTKKCMETLGVDMIDMLMVHSVDDYEQDPDIVRDTFKEMKATGMIRYSAVSAYSTDDYFSIAASGFDAVQIPINVFDHGRIEDGGIKAIADAGMAIFARSVFLQGLVFFTPETVDPRMDFTKPTLEKYRALCEEFGMPPAVLAASFVYSLPGITALVLGCQTPEQVDQNAAMMDSVRKLTDGQMAKIREAFLNIESRVINPRIWFNHT